MRRTTAALWLLAVSMMTASLAAGQRSTGDLIISGGDASTDARVQFRAMPAACSAAATADLASRLALPQWTESPTPQTKWGPDVRTYARVTASQVPTGCSPTAWAWYRFLATVNATVAMGLNYCHHHAPAYETPDAFKSACNPVEAGVDGGSCVCNAAGMSRPHPWRGVDCSNLSSWLYNLAFGFNPTSSIGAQACHPTRAPGRLLHNITAADQEQLAPGDLLYITLGRSGRSPPVRVSHVVLWTGWTVDFSGRASGPLANASLVANLPPEQRRGAVACMRAHRADGRPVFVIADSTYSGPNLRPFCGWYASSFSHARRLINVDVQAWPAANNATVAAYNRAGDDCLSNWALV